MVKVEALSLSRKEKESLSVQTLLFDYSYFRPLLVLIVAI